MQKLVGITQFQGLNRRALIIRTVVVIVCSVILFGFVYQNCEQYSKPIAKITQVTETKNRQTITAKLENGEQKGRVLTIENNYDSAFVYDEKYNKGDFVFISNDGDKIMGLKRDYQVVAVFLLLLSLLVILGGRQGSFTVLCLIINVTVVIGMTLLYLKGRDILALSVVGCIFFAAIVLVFISGWNKTTLISFSVTIAATAFIGALVFVLLKTGKNVGYEYLDFLPEPYTIPEANRFFLAQIVIGCLGAVMDIAVTITACATELIRKTPKISMKQLIRSVREVADDITGTMLNVVFFTNIAAVIPVFTISMANDIGFMTVVKYDAYFEIARFLTAGIAILAAIPLSIWTSSLFLKGGKNS